MNKSEQINELAAALCAAQKEMPVALKKSVNPHYKSKYADLAQIIELSTTILNKNGLSISQFPISNGDMSGVRTWLIHTSGQFICDEVLLQSRGRSPQDMASGITYARRYAWQSVIGMAADIDDDGNAASGVTQKEETIDTRAELKQFLVDKSITIKQLNSLLSSKNPDHKEIKSVDSMDLDLVGKLLKNKEEILKKLNDKTSK